MGGRTDERFQSPALQREAMEEWAQRRFGEEHRWVEWFEDLDQTGSSIDRPSLNAARECAEAHGAHIIVYNLSRFSRSVPEGLTALATLERSNVQVLSASENSDPTTPEVELSLTMYMAMNQFQVRRLRDSWRNTIQSNRSAGWWHGVAPYGYRRLTIEEREKAPRVSGVIVIDEIPAAHVREMFRRFLAGTSAFAIGRDGVKLGWFQRVGTAEAILSNPAYAGMVGIGERAPAISKKTGQPLRDSNGRVKHFPKPGSVRYHQGRHEPIVSQRDFVLARKLRRLTRTQKPYQPIQMRWSSAGRTECANCSRNLGFHDKSKQTGVADAFYLICANRDCTAKPGSVRVAELEHLLAEAVTALALQVRNVSDEMQLRMSATESSSREMRRKLDASIANLRIKRARISAVVLSETWGEADISESEAKEALKLVRDELLSAEGQLAQLGPDAPNQGRLTGLRSSTASLAELWPALTLAERVAALEAIGAVVRIKPSRKRADTLSGRVVIAVPFVPSQDADGPHGIGWTENPP